MAAITVAMPAARLEGQEERIAAKLLRARRDPARRRRRVKLRPAASSGAY